MKKGVLVLMAFLSIISVSTLAQEKGNSKSKNKIEKIQKYDGKYNCPMHHNVSSDQAGKCPQCGMELVKEKKEHGDKNEKKEFTCPMHKDVTSDQAGKCPKCGMEMTRGKKEIRPFVCPMHKDVVSDKPGKCSKCGMELKHEKREHQQKD